MDDRRCAIAIHELAMLELGHIPVIAPMALSSTGGHGAALVPLGAIGA